MGIQTNVLNDSDNSLYIKLNWVNGLKNDFLIRVLG